MNFFLQYVRLNLGYPDKLFNRSVKQKRVALKKIEPDTKNSRSPAWQAFEREGKGISVLKLVLRSARRVKGARGSLARSRAQIPFPFPFERLPRGLNPRPRADVS